MHILGIREPAAPVGTDIPKLIGIQIFDGRSHIRNFKPAVTELCKALQHHGGNNRRRCHALKPSESAVGVTAGHYLSDKVLNRGRGTFFLCHKPIGHKLHIPGLGEGEDVVALRLNM